MKKIITLAFSDFKLIFRDASLRVFLLFPIVLLVVFGWVLPLLVEKYAQITPYIPVLLSMGVLSATQMFNFISSMVLIEEKETNVAKIYGVVPLSRWEYLLSRFLLPYFITAIITAALLLAQPFYHIAIGNIILISLLTSLIVPVYVMVMNTVAQNRVQGMVYIKAFNLIILIPVAAFFVPDSLKHLFGILPTHWIFQSIYNIHNDTPIGWVVSIGFIYFVLLLVYFSRVFFHKHFA